MNELFLCGEVYSLANEHVLINFFGIFSLFLIAYGFKLQVWERSLTTKYVIIFSFVLSTLIFKVDAIYITLMTVFFLLALFVAAILRKRDTI